MGEWNYIIKNRMLRAAEKAGHTFELVPKPMAGFPDGVDCFVNGEFRAWFASLEPPDGYSEEEEIALDAFTRMGRTR